MLLIKYNDEGYSDTITVDELPHDRAIDAIMAGGYYRDDKAEYELREE